MIDQMPEMGAPGNAPEDFEGIAPAPATAGNMARQNLSEAWKTRPMFRLMVIVMPVVAVAALAMGMFGGDSEVSAPLPTQGLRTSDLALNPAIPTTPEVKQSVEQYDSQKIDAALATGASAIATPMRESQDIMLENDAGDPLAEWRGASDMNSGYITEAMIEEQRAAPRAAQVDVEAQQRRQQENDRLAQAMQAQMNALMSAWVPKGAKVTMVEDVQKTQEAAAAAAAAQNRAPEKGVVEQGAVHTLAMAGDVAYAQVLTQANSDIPGPVLAHILTGKLKGARVLGNFEYTEEYLVVRFTTAVLGNLEYRIDAVALDPDTTLTGVATDVDNHYFKRIVLPAAGAFISGFASARAQTATSSTTTSGGQVVQDTEEATDEEQVYKGIENAADKIQEVLDKAGDVRPTVTLAANTPVGILFLQSVREMVK